MAAWERTGTVNVTQGSTTVTGNNTRFTEYSRVGDGFIGPDGANMEVVNIVSPTQLTLATPYQGPTAAGQVYALMPVQGYSKASADALRTATREFVSSIEGIDDNVEAAQAAATAAHASELSAHTSEANAAGSASAAAGSASAAGDASTSAGKSAIAAETAAKNSKTSETNAKTSETNAANSASAAAQSAQQAADKLSRSGGKMIGAIDWANFVALASADTVDIGGAASNLVQLTGTATVNAFKAANAGAQRRVLFTGVMTLVHSAKIVLPGGAPIVTAVGDWADFVCWDGTNWYCSQYQRNLNTPALLTQNTSDSTLGRILKVGDFGIGHTVSPIPPNGTNLNLLGVQGTYRLDSAYTGSPFGAARQGDVIEVLAWNGGVVHQNFYSIEGDVWYRKIDVTGNTQTPWRKIYGQLNIVGTVGQTNGVPSGAIIERGANANGNYTKFADGTLECWVYFLANYTGVAPAPQTVLTWTFPAAFVGFNNSTNPGGIITHATLGYPTANNNLDVARLSGYAASNTYAFVEAAWSPAQTVYICVSAKGRWF